jgi:hypothetical protein
MARDTDNALLRVVTGITLVQLPLMLAFIAYFKDPQFSMYTTNLRNATTKEMDIEVEDFSASVLYLATSAAAALFAVVSRGVDLASNTFYTLEALDELSMWDLSFWTAVMMQHACIVTYMCSPLDWYFLTLVVIGITLMLMLMSRIPLSPNGRSRESTLMLMSGLLFLMLYSTVRLHGHGGYFVGMLIMDGLILIGHTFDSQPDMLTVGNARLSYLSGMSGMILLSYVQFKV